MDTDYKPKGLDVVTGAGVGDFDFLAGDWDRAGHSASEPTVNQAIPKAANGFALR